MDVELLAALCALGLAVLVLVLLICRVYLLSPKLTATIRSTAVRALDAGTFACQIDLDVAASGGDIDLRKWTISHAAAVFDPERGVNAHSGDSFIVQAGCSALDGDREDIPKQLSKLLDRSLDTAGLRLPDGAKEQVSIIDLILPGRTEDGYGSWPTEGWTLTIRNSAGSVKIPFSFAIHRANDINAFCLNYGPSGTMVWSC